MKANFESTRQSQPIVRSGQLTQGTTAVVKPDGNQHWRLGYATITVIAVGGVAASVGNIKIEMYDGTNARVLTQSSGAISSFLDASASVSGLNPIITTKDNYFRFNAAIDVAGGTYTADYVAVFEVV